MAFPVECQGIGQAIRSQKINILRPIRAAAGYRGFFNPQNKKTDPMRAGSPKRYSNDRLICRSYYRVYSVYVANINAFAVVVTLVQVVITKASF